MAARRRPAEGRRGLVAADLLGERRVQSNALRDAALFAIAAGRPVRVRTPSNAASRASLLAGAPVRLLTPRPDFARDGHPSRGAVVRTGSGQGQSPLDVGRRRRRDARAPLARASGGKAAAAADDGVDVVAPGGGVAGDGPAAAAGLGDATGVPVADEDDGVGCRRRAHSAGLVWVRTSWYKYLQSLT